MTLDLTSALMIAGPIIGWGWFVEQRLSAHQAIIDKLDKLIDIVLEDRLGQNTRLTPHAEREDH